MNFVTELDFNQAMSDPREAAALIRRLKDDLCIAIAIMGGPQGTEEGYKRLIYQMRMELLAGAIVAKRRLDEHLAGDATAIIPKIVLPH